MELFLIGAIKGFEKRAACFYRRYGQCFLVDVSIGFEGHKLGEIFTGAQILKKFTR
jgi:hypothetical protein